jgi:aminopeptidase N
VFGYLQTLFRVYATSNQKERVRYALEIGANITDYFEDYFEVSSLHIRDQGSML